MYNPTYYLYRHIRHDLNVPFYIGIGKVREVRENSYTETAKYCRAFSNDRNVMWRGIVKSTTYGVEILYESKNKEEILKKETEFILLYGRKDINTGTLANLTDGGEGSFGVNIEIIKNTVAKNRANGCFKKTSKILSDWNREFCSKHKTGRAMQPWSKCLRKTYVYSNTTGKYLAVYNSRRDARKWLNVGLSISKYANLGLPLSGYLFFNEYKGDQVETIPDCKCKILYQIDASNGEIVKSFGSLKDAAFELNIAANSFCSSVKNRKSREGYIYSYDKNVDISQYTESRKTSKKGTRKVECSRCGLEKEAARINDSYCNSCYRERTRIWVLKNKIA